jgi:hypothetical protein
MYSRRWGQESQRLAVRSYELVVLMDRLALVLNLPLRQRHAQPANFRIGVHLQPALEGDAPILIRPVQRDLVDYPARGKAVEAP